MPKPVCLTDDQLTHVIHAASPLAPNVRGAFLETLALALQQQSVIGDGSVHRAIAEAQRRFFDPPDLSRARDQSKYR